jgi:HSP20 family protein
MLTRWYDINREMATLDELGRRLSSLFGQSWSRGVPGFERTGWDTTWPQANLFDTGSSLTAVIQTPGLRESDVTVEVQGDVLTVSGERQEDTPEGYRVHRRERGTQKFTRSFGLPCSVDPERTRARLVNGRLTVAMEKHADARPKQITVSAS